uniref:Uncharacterized protein n=1 Tax=Periophthalmus magnuspinnatus TaxID=409849 RepID=A0A3B3Z9T6_9GOBI
MSSYLETPSPGRQLLDDTIPLSATIEASQNLQSHTVSGISLPLPPKKLIGNMDREFIAERQRGLQAYLDYITQHPLLCSCLTVKRFLDPNNYATNYTEIALQQVSMFFRSDPKWEVQEPLKDMGWRIRKKYFMIKNKEQPKERYLLSWVDLGPDKFLSDKDLQSAIKLLSTLPVRIWEGGGESSALIIRPFSERGSLRDHICKVKPRESYLKKYCNPKKSQGLDLPSIKLYGRTILEALRLLHSSGLFCGHLHCCNVLLEEGSIRLVDLENGLLGTPSAVRPLFTQFRKVNTTESIDVFSFGLVLFEMTYGWPPDSVPIDQFSDVPHPTVGSVLQSLLSSEALKFGLPSVSALLQTPYVTVPSRLKEALKSAKENLERRLQEEQRQLHQHRRLTRAQSHHCSDEERKRRKLLARKVLQNKIQQNNRLLTLSPPTCPSSPTPPPTGQCWGLNVKKNVVELLTIIRITANQTE